MVVIATERFESGPVRLGLRGGGTSALLNGAGELLDQ